MPILPDSPVAGLLFCMAGKAVASGRIPSASVLPESKEALVGYRQAILQDIVKVAKIRSVLPRHIIPLVSPVASPSPKPKKDVVTPRRSKNAAARQITSFTRRRAAENSDLDRDRTPPEHDHDE